MLARINDLVAEAHQKFEGRVTNFREKGVDETGDEETNVHLLLIQYRPSDRLTARAKTMILIDY